MKTTDSKVVLITGACRGIGAGIAKGFAKQGVCLSLCAIDKENFDEVVEECLDLGAKEAIKIVTDLTIEENMKMVIDTTINKFGRLDVLVNNAGIACGGGVLEIKMDDFDKAIKVNTKTPLYLTQLAVPYLEKTKGNIINTSSLASKLFNLSPLLGYCMSKAALDQFTKMAAFELAAKGIRVNSVHPSGTNTAIFNSLAKIYGVDVEVAKEAEAQNHPLENRLLEVEDIANAVLFLASDEASMITGVNLPVDGGRLLTGK